MVKANDAFVITGVPGTGKSTVAKLIAKKMKALLIDANKFAKENELFAHIDREDMARVVKLGKFGRLLKEHVEEKSGKRCVIVEGHLACEVSLPAKKVIVLRCDPAELRKRLAKRKYPPEKISKNALSEALDYCVILSEKNYGKAKVWEVDTTGKNANKSALEAEKILLGKTRKKKSYSWPDALMKEALLGTRIRGIA